MAAANGLSAAADTGWLKTILGVSGGFTSPSSNGLYVALYSTQFTVASKAGAAEWTTASDTNYARVQIGVTGWTIAAWTSTGTVASNTNQLQFAAVAGNSQTLFSVGLCDTAGPTGGNVILIADLSTSSTVGIGIYVQFNASTDIQVTLL